MRKFLLSSVRLPLYAPDEKSGAADGDTKEEDETEETKEEEPEEKKEVEDKKEEPEEKEDWRDKEIGRKHRQLQEERAEKARLKQELDDTKALLERRKDKEDDDSGEKRPAKKVFTEEEVKQEARRLRAQEAYDEKCNETYAEGKKVYGDKWDKSVNRIKELGGLELDDMQSIMATDDPAQVLFVLGDKPEEYQRIMALPEARRRNEMTKLALKEAKVEKKISKAPEPVDDIKGKSKPSTEPRDDDDDETWYAKRAAQRKAARAARQ